MINFIEKRNYFFIFTSVIVLVGIVSFVINGFVMDVDFMGGTIIEIDMGGEFDSAEVASTVEAVTGAKVTVQKMGGAKQQVAIKSGELSQEQREAVFEAIKNKYNLNDSARLRTSDVQAIMGKELRKKGVTAAVFASILILAYTAFRFRKVSGFIAGTTAIIALVHDIFVMLCVYSIFRIPINSTFVAAALTILGYSINDTIVVYDRIRENQALYVKKDFSEIVNISINQSITRALYTTLTTAIAVVCIYVAGIYYGVQSIKEFAFPIIIGLISGTYSSIFIASPLWVMWKELESKNKVVKKAIKA